MVEGDWANLGVCNSCGKKQENSLLYHCPLQHKFCEKCFENIQKYCGSMKNEYICELCDTPVKFERKYLNSNFLRQIKRSQRLKSVPPQKELNDNKNLEPVTLEALFGLPKSDLKKLFDKNQGDCLYEIEDFKEHKIHNILRSHQPITCPHHSCRKPIAVSSFTNHFKYEHKDLGRYAIEKNEELILPFDVNLVEYDKSYCLGMITVYESNKMDLIKSRSTHSVIKTCNKFCQKIPLDTFWLMLTGSKSKTKSKSYLLIWLFKFSIENYHATIELSSKEDNFSVSSFCGINSISENFSPNEIAASLNCLYLRYGQVLGLLEEGNELNLRVTVH